MLKILYTGKKNITCYKTKHELKQQDESEDISLQDSSEIPEKKLRGDSSLHNQPSPKESPTTFPRIVCGRQKNNRTSDKYRISETTRAKTFLATILFFFGGCMHRTCDLQAEFAVFGADVYYHKLCLTA